MNWGTGVFPYVFCLFFVFCEETGAGCFEYSGERRTSTSYAARGVHDCFSKKKVWILREDTGARRYIIISKRSTFGNAAREE
jgi:hypothetical protein